MDKAWRARTLGPGTWLELVDWHRKSTPRPGSELASEADLAIPRCVPDAKEALAIVREHQVAWARRARA